VNDLGAAAPAARPTVPRTAASSDWLLAALVAVVLRAEGRLSFLHAAVTRPGAPSALAGVVHLILLASWLVMIDVP
jgi:Ca2+/H+ antiporter